MAHLFASRSQEISRRESRNLARSRRIAAQGMVLFENDGVLPLAADGRCLAAFGSGVRRTVKGGTGSGDVNVRTVYSVEHGLQDAGFRVQGGAWLDRFDALCAEALADYTRRFTALVAEKGPAGILDALEHPYRDPDVPPILESDLEGADRDTALYVIARTSGEGSDRRPEPGDYELSPGEIANLKTLTGAFRRVVVVLNAGGVMDTRFLRSQPGISALLLMGQGGSAGGLALADVLTGRVTPEGCLAATWAEQYADYPCADSFGRQNGDLADEYYREGIYVGYRYFDSFGIKPAYPFGFGRSYTEFTLQPGRISIAGNEVRAEVLVQNAGTRFSGRQTVQLYVSQPEGTLPKPYQILAGFAKTGELAPGETETLTVSFPLTALACYDETRAAWVLEAGLYYIRVGRHSRDTHIAAALRLDEAVITEQLQNRAAPCQPLDELRPAPGRFFTYPGEEQEKQNALVLEVIAAALETRTAVYSAPPLPLHTGHTETVTLEDLLAGRALPEDLTAQLTDRELTELCVGSARGGFGSASMVGAASALCPGAAGDTISALLESRGVPNLVLADGPAGLRLSRSFVADSQGNVIPGLGESALGGLETLFGVPVPERPADAVDYYQYCTALPIATQLAQTWDPRLIEEAGDIVGSEMEEFGVTLWLAPGMNIQRNPLCGRNFEYFSEDPLLSGLCAAAQTRGVQKHPGCGVTIKHFALNNQEDNRAHNNAHCGERALREIYLRGFEIAVKTAAPLALMSSYNLVNGVHAANHKELLTAILRDEWGFGGLVMTDWGTTGGGDMNPAMDAKYGCSDPVLCIRAGNDLIMPGSQQDADAILAAVESGALPRAELQACAGRVLALAKYRAEHSR